MTQPTAFQQGRYQVRYEMGRDACGIVLLGIDSKIANREVLIRRIAENASVTLMQRIAQISHPTLPPVYDFFEEDGHRYLVQEHPSGQSLGDIVLGPPLKEQVVVAWARQIAAGLSYLHQQRPALYHGDLRPGTIILQEGRQIKLTGGLPSGCAQLPPTRYSSPERWNGAPPDALSDQYAFAATLHHLLTGLDPNSQPLHHWVEPTQRRPEISETLSTVLMQALAAEPAQRFASVEAMMQALLASAGTQVAPVVPHSTPAKPQPVPRAAEGATLSFEQLNRPASEPQPQAAQTAAPRPRQAPPRPGTRRQTTADYDDSSDRRGTIGALVLGMALALVILGGIGWFIWNSLGNPDGVATPAPLVGDFDSVPTITRDEGRELTSEELTATVLALTPPVINTPTIGPEQLTAEAELTAIVETAVTTEDQIESFYQTGIVLEDSGQLDLALQQYQRVLELDPNYKDTQQRVQNIQTILNGTATAIAGIEATAVAETAIAQIPTETPAPTDTPTPEAPTPTPEGMLLGDSFEGTELDEARWTTRPGDGEIIVADGEVLLKGDSANCFPLVQHRVAEPVSEDFDLQVTFQYSQVTSLGTGIIIASTPAETCGPVDRSGTYWFGIWQDDQVGLVFDFHRDFDPEAGPEQDIRQQLSDGAVDTEEHVLRVERRGGIDRFFLDDTFLFEERASEDLQALWFGNPGRSPDAGTWTSFVVKDIVWE